MPTATEEQVQQKTKAHALEVEKKLKTLVANIVPAYWQTAELISQIHAEHTWEILGYGSVNDYREAIAPLSKGNWYQRRKLWDEWAKPAMDREAITRARLNRMNSQNAQQLLRLPEKFRFAQKWIEYALNLKESQLEAKVDHVLENDDDDETTLGQPEAIAILKVRCTTSQKEFIKDVMEQFAKKQDPQMELDDEGHILERLAAHWLAGPQTPEEAEEETQEASR